MIHLEVDTTLQVFESHFKEMNTRINENLLITRKSIDKYVDCQKKQHRVIMKNSVIKGAKKEINGILNKYGNA
ncbi:unnamed protein product [Heterobilharzia americana]|nr:unnamed protein product [Heterobilharzia americana]